MVQSEEIDADIEEMITQKENDDEDSDAKMKTKAAVTIVAAITPSNMIRTTIAMTMNNQINRPHDQH